MRLRKIPHASLAGGPFMLRKGGPMTLRKMPSGGPMRLRTGNHRGGAQPGRSSHGQGQSLDARARCLRPQATRYCRPAEDEARSRDPESHRRGSPLSCEQHDDHSLDRCRRLAVPADCTVRSAGDSSCRSRGGSRANGPRAAPRYRSARAVGGCVDRTSVTVRCKIKQGERPGIMLNHPLI